jgi:aerobic-type carbon monoxide dehydrogenase small subunit (CoxS/CutS family)
METHTTREGAMKLDVLCRCGTYQRIREGVHRAAALRRART